MTTDNFCVATMKRRFIANICKTEVKKYLEVFVWLVIVFLFCLFLLFCFALVCFVFFFKLFFREWKDGLGTLPANNLLKRLLSSVLTLEATKESFLELSITHWSKENGYFLWRNMSVEPINIQI